MKCYFCKKYVNDKRHTTVYGYIGQSTPDNVVPIAKWGRKIRWCKECDTTKTNEIDKVLSGKGFLENE